MSNPRKRALVESENNNPTKKQRIDDNEINFSERGNLVSLDEKLSNELSTVIEIPFLLLPDEIKKYIATYKLDSKESKIEVDGKAYWEKLSLEDQKQLLLEYQKISGYYDSFPTDIQSLISEYISDDQAICIDTKNFTIEKYNHSQYYCALFQNRLTVLALCDHVVKGQYDAVKNMLDKASINPQLLRELLTTPARVMTYSNIVIQNKVHSVEVEGTAFQLALGAGDVNTGKDNEGKDKNDGMAEMIVSFFPKIKNGEAEKANQIQAQFPNGWEEKENECYKKDFEALHKVVRVIGESKQDDDNALVAALDEFRMHLCRKTVIKTGMHFNARLLIDALRLYEKHDNAFGGSDYLFGRSGGRKSKVCWENVIGSIQRFLSACDAQAFCRGFDLNLFCFEKFNRSLKLDINQDPCRRDVNFFPLDSSRDFRLGHDFAVSLTGYLNPQMDGQSTWIFEKFMSSKNMSMMMICASYRQTGNLFESVSLAASRKTS